MMELACVLFSHFGLEPEGQVVAIVIEEVTGRAA